MNMIILWDIRMYQLNIYIHYITLDEYTLVEITLFLGIASFSFSHMSLYTLNTHTHKIHSELYRHRYIYISQIHIQYVYYAVLVNSSYVMLFIDFLCFCSKMLCFPSVLAIISARLFNLKMLLFNNFIDWIQFLQ